MLHPFEPWLLACVAALSLSSPLGGVVKSAESHEWLARLAAAAAEHSASPAPFRSGKTFFGQF